MTLLKTLFSLPSLWSTSAPRCLWPVPGLMMESSSLKVTLEFLRFLLGLWISRLPSSIVKREMRLLWAVLNSVRFWQRSQDKWEMLLNWCQNTSASNTTYTSRLGLKTWCHQIRQKQNQVMENPLFNHIKYLSLILDCLLINSCQWSVKIRKLLKNIYESNKLIKIQWQDKISEPLKKKFFRNYISHNLSDNVFKYNFILQLITWYIVLFNFIYIKHW